MKRGSAKHNAEERLRSATAKKKILRTANGWMLIKTMAVVVIISNAHAMLYSASAGFFARVRWPLGCTT
jgi:hypothetical protein